MSGSILSTFDDSSPGKLGIFPHSVSTVLETSSAHLNDPTLPLSPRQPLERISSKPSLVFPPDRCSTQASSFSPNSPLRRNASDQPSAAARPAPFELNHEPTTHPASQPVGRKRCGIPLFLCFLIPVMAVAGVFFSVSWVTLHGAAVRSIESVSSRVHQVTELHLRRTVEGFLEHMMMITALAHASISAGSSPADVREVFRKTMIYQPHPFYLTYVNRNGLTVGMLQEQDGAYAVSYRPADCPSDPGYTEPRSTLNCSTNLTAWHYNVTTGIRSEPAYLTHPYDGRTRIWYQMTATRGGATFTPPFILANTVSTPVICFAIPVFESVPTTQEASVLNAVVVMTSFFSSLTDALQQSMEALQTNGVLLLLNADDGLPLACSAKTLPSAKDRNRLMDLPLPLEGATTLTSHVTLDGFGDSYALQISFVGRFAKEFETPGISWRLFLVIPKSEYFEVLDQQNRFEIGFVSAAIALFFVLHVVLLRALFINPFRRLFQQLESIKDFLQLQTSRIEIPVQTSPFSELAALQTHVMDVVGAAEEAIEQRAWVLCRTRETEQQNEEMQRLLRAKEIFFAMIVHELSPMHVASILKANVFSESQKKKKELVVILD